MLRVVEMDVTMLAKWFGENSGGWAIETLNGVARRMSTTGKAVGMMMKALESDLGKNELRYHPVDFLEIFTCEGCNPHVETYKPLTDCGFGAADAAVTTAA